MTDNYLLEHADRTKLGAGTNLLLKGVEPATRSLVGFIGSILPIRATVCLPEWPV